jgi:hypothetical protein
VKETYYAGNIKFLKHRLFRSITKAKWWRKKRGDGVLLQKG